MGTCSEADEPVPLQEKSNGRVMSTIMSSPLRTIRCPELVSWRPEPRPCTAIATASYDAPRAALASRTSVTPVLRAVKRRALPNSQRSNRADTPLGLGLQVDVGGPRGREHRVAERVRPVAGGNVFGVEQDRHWPHLCGKGHLERR